jgi:1,4-dihydroxy-2-naphthoate octaprenyltransferase
VWWHLALAAVVSLALQVGVNYANDYSDGVRGTDEVRVGPLRLVGSGTASAQSVKRAAFFAFGIAAIAGLVLALTTSLWLILVGVAAIVAAWTYTGGPRPYGYAGFGELFVFVFFGVVATVGSEYAVIKAVSSTAVIASVAVGVFACALLVVNNLRDIPGDTVAGKNTLAVRLGDARTRQFFGLLVVIAALAIICTSVTAGAFASAGLVGVIALRPALNDIARGAKGGQLISVLGAVGRAQLILAITYCAGLIAALHS